MEIRGEDKGTSVPRGWNRTTGTPALESRPLPTGTPRAEKSSPPPEGPGGGGLVTNAEERLRHLEAELWQCAHQGPQAELVAALQTLRGIGLLSAVTIVAEVSDLRRFARTPGFMAFTGLVPSEYSSGESQHRGPITKTGNAYLRHVLIQAAHNARYVPNSRLRAQQRRVGLPPDLIELAWRAQVRLHQRYRHLVGRLGRPKAVTAVARELAGFVWAVGQRMPEAAAA